MQSCDQQRLERFCSPHAGAFANIGDVVVLDIPGHKPGQPMTVLEVYRTTGEILCVWHGRGGTPNRATFHAAELRVIQRAPKSVDGALNFDPQIASVFQHPSLAAQLRSGGVTMCALVQINFDHEREITQEDLLDLTVRCNWHDDDGQLWVEHYPLITLMAAA